MSSYIRLKKINKIFDLKNKVRALKNINLEFNLGKIYSIVGPSGSGKSTLLNMLSLIDSPTSGHLKINNLNIITGNNNENDNLRASLIGIIYQNYLYIFSLIVHNYSYYLFLEFYFQFLDKLS